MTESIKLHTSLYPGDSAVVLAEFAKRSPLEGLSSAQTLFPYNTAFGVDKVTEGIYIRGRYLFDGDDLNPDSLSGRVGVSRIYEPIDGSLVDGFIADFRFAHPGRFAEIMLTLPTDPDSGRPVDLNPDDMKRIEQAREERFQPLLAAVMNDTHGKLAYFGDPRLISHMEALIGATDDMAASLAAPGSDPVPRTAIFRGPAGYTAEFNG